MSKLIRKISIGKDYKSESMHYSVGQEVYGGHRICDIVEEEEGYDIFIKKITMLLSGRTLIKIWLYL